jgi:hypothetical protein
MNNTPERHGELGHSPPPDPKRKPRIFLRGDPAW